MTVFEPESGELDVFFEEVPLQSVQAEEGTSLEFEDGSSVYIGDDGIIVYTPLDGEPETFGAEGSAVSSVTFPPQYGDDSYSEDNVVPATTYSYSEPGEIREMIADESTHPKQLEDLVSLGLHRLDPEGAAAEEGAMTRALLERDDLTAKTLDTLYDFSPFDGTPENIEFVEGIFTHPNVSQVTQDRITADAEDLVQDFIIKIF